MRGYYFITDASLSRAGNLCDVAAAMAAGVRVVQYRQKQGRSRDLAAEARQLRELCRGTRFLINDRVDLALEVGADGVHLGQEDLHFLEARRRLGPDKIIGLTVHNLAEALAAQAMGADYLGVSPIFSTITKADAGAPAGVALLAEIRRYVDLPLIAIGGITLANAPEVIAAGADGVCAISAVVTKAEVRPEIEKFQRLFRPVDQ
ncbi:MAG: thiamine phosphate synthase [Syntrophobacterales bacterium]|jgi:thiamine-phosphate pyrophosphorylase|nr:thiamine phosphate synthase [Syntrophobacterales bacterium]